MAKESDDTEELVHLLWRVARLFRQSGRGNDRFTPAERFLLWQLWRYAELRGTSGGIRVTELARSLSLTTAAVTQLVRKLEWEGVVQRGRLAEDRRAVTVSLTEAGIATWQRLQAEKRFFFRRLLAQIDPGDRRELRRILRQLLEEAADAEAP